MSLDDIDAVRTRTGAVAGRDGPDGGCPGQDSWEAYVVTDADTLAKQQTST